jgi:hypothetical protein
LATNGSNQAMEDDERRLPGTVPSATILMINSTRYKINGAQAIAFTDTTSRILQESNARRRAEASPPERSIDEAFHAHAASITRQR